MTAAAPTPDRPEGGEVERLARAFHDVRRNFDNHVLPWNLVGEHVKVRYRARAQVFLATPREPEPVMPPLPTEPLRHRLGRRLREIGATRERSSFANEESTWINAPIEDVLDEVDRLAEWEAEQDGDTVRVPLGTWKWLGQLGEAARKKPSQSSLAVENILIALRVIDFDTAERGDRA